MEPEKQPRPDAKLKNLPEADQEALWDWLHPSDPDAKRMTLDEAQAEVPLRWGFTVSRSSLSEWRAWYALRRRMNAARERAEQTRLELIADGTLTPDAIEKAAQTVFTAESLDGGNVKAFVALAKLNLARRKLDQDERRIALLEKKASAYDELKKAAESREGGVTAEDMAEIERRLKLM